MRNDPPARPAAAARVLEPGEVDRVVGHGPPEPRAATTACPLYPLTLLYDSSCAVCRLEMDELRERDAAAKLRLIDISAPGFDAAAYGATLAEMNALLHAVDAQGRTHRGVAALRMAYTAVGLGRLVAPTGWPLLRPLFDGAYAVFARHRYGISRLARPLIERIAAARAARRMQRCARGVCER
jgi:predicted DCC family thiol-disulfide oxidoreductase YuxK